MEIMSVIQACLLKASLVHGVDISTMSAIADIESKYEIMAESHTKDYGLMQLHGKKIHDPCKNANEGAKLLKDAKLRLTKKLGDAWVIGYNLGVTGARKFSKASAKNFVYYKKFKKAFKPLNALELLLFKNLPKVNTKHVTVPYRMF